MRMTERIYEESVQAEPIAPESVAAPSGVFDISDADGVNESERLLTKLCRQSFLSLWSFANLHTDQDMHGGQGSAKEFADVLVVFGNDVVIFSDKHIVFQQDNEVDVAWRRWYDRAIASSAKQLHGAMSWARRFPGRVFIDSQCRRALPVEIPDASRARYHLVAVTRGSRDACLQYFGGGSGSLFISTEVIGQAHVNHPFAVGIVSPEKAFVHVFDEYSLGVMLGELDTTRDLIDYLCDREIFLAAAGTVIAPGEEQLLAAYLQNADAHGRRFLSNSTCRSSAVVLDDSFYQRLISRPEYRAKKRLEQASYEWDRIIERFIRIGDPALVAPSGYIQLNNETESALRIMASESRFRRRLLMESLL